MRPPGLTTRPSSRSAGTWYVRPKGPIRRIMSRIWQPWIGWAYGASFDRHTEKRVPEAGLELVESRYVVDDLLKLITVRSPR